MILNFSAYNIISESVSLKELEKGNKRNLSYGDIKKGFLSRGYEFLGNVSIKVKSINAFAYDEILNVVPDELCEKLKKCNDLKYISHHITKSNLDIHTFGNDDAIDTILSVFSEQNIEKVLSCFTKKGDLYYVLWNNDKKYFYYMTIDNSSFNSNNGAIGFLELFIKIRTSGIEEVTKEVDELYDKYLEKVRQREEEEEMEREEKRIKKEKKDAYQKRVDELKADVEEHPENYVEVDRSEIKDIIDELNSDDYMDSKYVKYVQSIGEVEPYGDEPVMVYINDDEFTNGYKYKSYIRHSSANTYWGD